MCAIAVQTTLPFDCCPAAEAAEALSIAAADARGAVFTRREVVDFVLDLIGYQADQPLHRCRLLEPSAGHGDFLIPAIERLLASYRGDDPVRDLAASIRAVEIHRASIGVLRCGVIASIVDAGHSADTAARLADVWLVQGDFLLEVFDREFSHIVGNPPYLRQEAIPAALLIEYRARYATIFDRADLYVPFFERSLSLLSPAGRLGFICSDRWTKNRYGGPLRALVTSDFHLSVYVDMVGTPAFLSDVIAYPAITVIAREPNGATRLARRPELDPAVLADLARRLTESGDGAGVESVRLPEGTEPWMFGKSGMLDLVRDLESRYPTLEEVGCKVGIGVATGADSAFIARYDDLDVEPERKLPLITTRDIREGVVDWRGLGVLNPFHDDGGLVDLRDYPRFAAWLRLHEAQIRGRNVARRNPQGWYRTIDRIHAELTTRPKLLIPDIKGDAHVVLEDGRFYPHHNLYYIVSDEWDLHALQAVLQSGIARLFVAAYSVRMHGGHLRFQAQYLRRIRLPRWSEVPAALRKALASALPGGNAGQMDRLVAQLYGLQADELAEALRHS